MQDLNAIRLFVAVVDSGGFGTAARRLGVPIATVSRKVRELEDRLRVPLLTRTTRRVALTEAGAAYHEHCSLALREIDEAESAVGLYERAPRGLLRVAAPYSLAQFVLAPALSAFVERFPLVQVDLQLRNDPVDPVRDDFDLVIRIGPPEQETLVARPLGGTSLALYASVEHGGMPLPATLEALSQARVAAFQAGRPRGRIRWTLSRPGGRKAVTEQIEVRPTVVTNDPNILARVVLGGGVIAPLPGPIARPLVRDGRVRQVLAPWTMVSPGFFAVYPSRRGMSPKVRAFLDFTVEQFERVRAALQPAHAEAAPGRREPSGPGEPPG